MSGARRAICRRRLATAIDYQIYLDTQSIWEGWPSRPKISHPERFLRQIFDYPRIIEFAMSTALAIVLKPLTWGWAVCLTNGRELARFYGPGAHWRALRYLRTALDSGAPALLS
jgi:hypothetical protein